MPKFSFKDVMNPVTGIQIQKRLMIGKLIIYSYKYFLLIQSLEEALTTLNKK